MPLIPRFSKIFSQPRVLTRKDTSRLSERRTISPGGIFMVPLLGTEFVPKADFSETNLNFNTPVGSSLELTEAKARQVDAIIRNATKLKDIIENLSSVDNYQTGMARIHQRKVSMARIAEEVVASFQEFAKQKGVQIRTNLGRNELLIEADGSKIAIALSNLVKNAITFADPGGHVYITTEAVPGYVKVSVMDDGVGIPPEDLPRVFERFFQVESHLTRRHGGMGLGLSVAKAMIEMHGGRIWAESLVGKGTNFTFLLPLDPQQTTAASKVFIE